MIEGGIPAGWFINDANLEVAAVVAGPDMMEYEIE